MKVVSCLSLASMVESSRGGLRDGGLPCGGCQRFESAYLQPVILNGKWYMIPRYYSDPVVLFMISRSWTLIIFFNLVAP
jgi:hypothetical protein